MSSKDLSLALVEHLNLLKQNKTDYLLICIEPGKNVDRADVWYELADKDSPKNLLEACLNLFLNVYDKDDLIDVLITFCQELDEGNEQSFEKQLEQIQALLPPPKNKKKKTPPPNEPPPGISI